jgi:hypothetical protein
MEPLYPLGIADVGLASGHVLGIACIDEEHGKAASVEELEDRKRYELARRWSAYDRILKRVGIQYWRISSTTAGMSL